MNIVTKRTDGKAYYTVAELARRWGVSKQVIYRKIDNRELVTNDVLYCKRIPAWAVEKAEGQANNPLSPFERRNLESVIREQKMEIAKLRATISQIIGTAAEAISKEA